MESDKPYFKASEVFPGQKFFEYNRIKFVLSLLFLFFVSACRLPNLGKLWHNLRNFMQGKDRG